MHYERLKKLACQGDISVRRALQRESARRRDPLGLLIARQLTSAELPVRATARLQHLETGPLARWPLSFSMDSMHLAVGSCGGRIVIWDLEQAMPSRLLSGHRGEVRAVAYTPESLVSVASDDRLRVWTHEGRVLREERLRGHRMGITDVAIVREGQLVVTSSAEPELKLWCLKARSKRLRPRSVPLPMACDEGRVRALCVSEDGCRAAVWVRMRWTTEVEMMWGPAWTRHEMAERVLLIDLDAGGSLLATHDVVGEGEGPPWCGVALSKGGLVWASHEDKGELRVEEVCDFLPPLLRGRRTAMVLSPGGCAAEGTDGGEVVIASRESVLDRFGPPSGSPVADLCWSRDERLLASSHVDGTVWLWAPFKA